MFPRSLSVPLSILLLFFNFPQYPGNQPLPQPKDHYHIVLRLPDGNTEYRDYDPAEFEALDSYDLWCPDAVVQTASAAKILENGPYYPGCDSFEYRLAARLLLWRQSGINASVYRNDDPVEPSWQINTILERNAAEEVMPSFEETTVSLYESGTMVLTDRNGVLSRFEESYDHLRIEGNELVLEDLSPGFYTFTLYEAAARNRIVDFYTDHSFYPMITLVPVAAPAQRSFRFYAEVLEYPEQLRAELKVISGPKGPGAAVELVDHNGNPVSPASGSPESGIYEGLVPGSYELRITPPEGYRYELEDPSLSLGKSEKRQIPLTLIPLPVILTLRTKLPESFFYSPGSLLPESRYILYSAVTQTLRDGTVVQKGEQILSFRTSGKEERIELPGAGTYTLVQSSCHPSCISSFKPFTFTADYDKNSVTILPVTLELKQYRLCICDPEDEGAFIRLYRDSALTDQPLRRKITAGEAVFEGLEPGTYYLQKENSDAVKTVSLTGDKRIEWKSRIREKDLVPLLFLVAGGAFALTAFLARKKRRKSASF